MLAVGAVLFLTAVKTDVFDGFIGGWADEASEEVVIDRSFSVQPGERLLVDIDHSDVHIEPADGNEARVRVTLDGRNMDRAREFFEHLNFVVEQEAGTLSVRTDTRSNWNGSSGGADIDVLVAVPEVFDADLDVAHGDVDVASLKGRLDFRLAHGDLSAGILAGPSLSLRTAHGDVDGESIMSETVTVDIQHGDMSVGRVTAPEVDISAAHGDVDIDELDGYPRISVQHGDVDVSLAAMRGGEFRTQHGDVALSAPSGSAADVEFEASGIDVDSAFQFEGMRRDDTFKGRINGGGPVLSIRSSHGDLDLATR